MNVLKTLRDATEWIGYLAGVGYDVVQAIQKYGDKIGDMKVRDAFPNWKGWKFRGISPNTAGLKRRMKEMRKG